MAFTLTQPLYATGGTYTPQQDRLLIGANAVTPGVRNIPTATTGDLAVTTSGAANASVSIASGDVWVSAGSGQGMYYAYNDAAYTLGTVGSNTSGSTRVDLVVAQVTPATPVVAFAILSNQVPPYTPANCTVLATITVKNGFVGSGAGVMQVYNADGAGVYAYITDLRPKAQLMNFSVPATSYVPSPVQGNMVFDTSVQKAKIYTSAGWGTFITSTSGGFTNTDLAPGYLLTYQSASTLPPTSPVEGMVWYQTDTDLVFAYNGSSWGQIGSTASTQTFSTWQTFTVSCKQGTTPTQTTQYARFSRIGKMITGNFYISFQNGTVGNSGTAITVTTSGLPAPVRQLNVGSYAFNKTGDGLYTGVAQLTTTPTFIFYQGGGGTYNSQLGVTPLVSIGTSSGGASDHIEGNFAYEAAA